AARAAIEIVRGSDGEVRRATLARHARQLRALVPRVGGAPASAIAPIAIGDDRSAMRCTERLLAEGIFVQGIRPPTVPVGTARLRVGLSSAHSIQDIETASELLNRVLGAEDLP